VITAPVIAFVQDVGLSAPVYHQKVVCLHAEHLLRWLTSVPGHLSPQQVHQVGSSLDAAFPPRTGSSKPLTVATVEGYRHRRAIPVQAQEPTRRVPAFYGGDEIFPAPPPYPYQGRRQGPTRGVSVLARARRLALRLLLLALLLFVALPLGLTALQHAATNAVTRVVPSPAPSQPVIVHKPTAPKVTRTPGR
jgi:hypothetical protein